MATTRISCYMSHVCRSFATPILVPNKISPSPFGARLLLHRVPFMPTTNIVMPQSLLVYNADKEEKIEMKWVEPSILFEYSESMKGRLLGLDVCRDYIQVALSGENLDCAPFLCELPMKSSMELAKDFQELISRYSVKGFVFTDYFHLWEHHNPNSYLEGFVQQLSNTRILRDVMYTYWEMNLEYKVPELFFEGDRVPEDLEARIRLKYLCSIILQNYLNEMHPTLWQLRSSDDEKCPELQLSGRLCILCMHRQTSNVP